MQSKQLTSQDKKVLKKAILQQVAAAVALYIILAAVYAFGLIVIHVSGDEVLGLENYWLKAIFTILIITSALIILFIKTRKSIKDLSSDKKWVEEILSQIKKKLLSMDGMQISQLTIPPNLRW